MSGFNSTGSFGFSAGGGGGTPVCPSQLIVCCDTGFNSSVRCASNNCASGGYSTAFGRCNTALGNYSTISGGYFNTTSGRYAFTGGGYANTTSGYYAFTGGGRLNETSGNYSGILGGCLNTISGVYYETFIVGSNINADRSCATFVNNLSVMNIPTSSAGLPTGAVWKDTAAGNVLKIV